MQDPTSAAIQDALSRGDLASAPVSDAERALLRFVELVTKHAYRTTDADVEALRAQGWTDPQIAECVYITALFAFFNRVADAFGLEAPNPLDALRADSARRASPGSDRGPTGNPPDRVPE